ncbi:MAG: hypothetical protein ACMUEL_09055 [Flavobacteriales bacterium Tduv]
MQYWIFEDGSVIKIRNHEGFYIKAHVHNSKPFY